VRITIESTEQLVEYALASQPNLPVGQMARARVWHGRTESGIPIQALIVRIAVGNNERQDEFERELRAQHAPAPAERAFSLRMIL